MAKVTTYALNRRKRKHHKLYSCGQTFPAVALMGMSILLIVVLLMVSSPAWDDCTAHVFDDFKIQVSAYSRLHTQSQGSMGSNMYISSWVIGPGIFVQGLSSRFLVPGSQFQVSRSQGLDPGVFKFRTLSSFEFLLSLASIIIRI